MPIRRALAALAALALTASIAVAAPASSPHRGQYTTPGPSSTKPPGDSAGSFGSIAAAGAKRPPDSTSVSLDALTSNPARYEGKVLARRVTLGATKPLGAGVAIAARDAETGGRVSADAQSAAFALLMTKELAAELADLHQTDVIITFVVTKIPIPDHETWFGIVSRVEVLGADGSVGKTVEAN